MSSWINTKAPMKKPEKTLTLSHKVGFFSTCSMILHNIVEYANKYKVLPEALDTIRVFDWYKPEGAETTSIMSEYFQESNTPIKYKRLEFAHWFQYAKYTSLEYTALAPYIQKYFSPSPNILSTLHTIEDKYSIDYSNTCVLFHRGNDKATETPSAPYSWYLDTVKVLQTQNPNLRFLIQSDETEFIEIMSRLPNSFYCKDEIRHIHQSLTTVDILFKKDNNTFSKYFLALILIMSKCKYVVCGTGNCSMWICLYRGNADGVYQFRK
jgi:hypothetical protein